MSSSVLNPEVTLTVPDDAQLGVDGVGEEEPVDYFPIQDVIPNLILKYQHIVCYGIPILGLLFWMGLVSGYIPSFLYKRGERWPRFYVYIQVVTLALTYWNLGPRTVNDWEELELAEMFEIVHILQSISLEQLFLHEDRLEYWYYMGQDVLGYVIVACSVRYILRPWEDGTPNNDGATKTKKKEPSMAWIVARNFGLFLIVMGISVFHSLSVSDYCHNGQVHVFSDWSPLEIHQRFAEAWKIFHRQDLWMTRLSHAMLYPTLILALTRRRVSDFLIWYLFFEFDMFHMLADMIHYAEHPELAYQRMEFMDRKEGFCFVDTYLLSELYAYPLNMVYLTTTWGNSVLKNATGQL